MAIVSPGLRQLVNPLATFARPSAICNEYNCEIGVNPSPLPSTLSIVDIENRLRGSIRKNQEDLLNAFREYDRGKTLSVTPGEFRRVLEALCMPLKTDQFSTIMNKVSVNPNGTVRYCDFLETFGARNKGKDQWISGSHRYNTNKRLSPKDVTSDMLDSILRDKIQTNLKHVIKALRLYDYNRDGQIQKHELRRVLETHCYRLTDGQFDKLFLRYDFYRRGTINYKDFLKQLGIKIPETNRASLSHGVPLATLTLQERAEKQQLINPPQRSMTSISVFNDKKHGINCQEQSNDLPKPPQLRINPCQYADDMNKRDKFTDAAMRELEIKFRTLMANNYTNIKRMFMLFDKHNDGTIRLEDLKASLCEFTIPLSEALFLKLMDRCGIKASGKISWEKFLDKFKDPQSHGNGQTIPIKPAHRFNPIRGVDVSMGLEEIVELLINQITNGYSSLKKAFLDIDKNRDGKITRSELRKVFDNLKVRITSDQMKQLHSLLDPTQSNMISYHDFLVLFEERETKEGHKWLNSCHRVNPQKPTIMAWEPIEEILRDKIENNWKDLSVCLVNCDPNLSQRISCKELRRCIERFTIPISDEHFEHLLSRVTDDTTGKVNYIDFLNMLGVSVKPGDLKGLSTQIHHGSMETEQKRLEGQVRRLMRGEMRAFDKTDAMSSSEIIRRLKDHFAQESPKIRKIFLKYDTKKKGKIYKSDFRKVLENMGFNMSDSTFEDLCSKLSFHNKYMDYTDFVNSFEDPRMNGPPSLLVKDSNHRVNAIRGDEYGLTAIEAESKLRKKLRENFDDLRAAFYKFDDDHNGLITIGNLRRMLAMFICPISDEEFIKLCARLNLTNKSRISYQEFLQRFEIRDSEDGHKWLISDHRYNEVQPLKFMTAKEVRDVITTKSHEKYCDLAEAFRTIDTKRDGIIKKNELKNILKKFNLPMQNEEFEKLWLMFDTDGKGAVTHDDFVKNFGGEQFAPSDDNGMSYNIIKESYTKLDHHHKGQQVKQQTITDRQANKVQDMNVNTILQELKDRIREQYVDFHTAFNKYDTNKRGYLTVHDIQKVLMDCNYFVNDDQFYDLLGRLNLHEKRRLSYNDFLAVFEEGRKDGYEKPPEEVFMPATMDERYPVEEAETNIRAKIRLKLETLEKVLNTFDHHKSGQISPPDIRRVLDSFCCKLTNAQFKHFASKIPMNKNGSVDYGSFIQSFKMSDTDAEKWIHSLNQRIRAESSIEQVDEQANQQLKDAIAENFTSLAKSFTDSDIARIGVVSREDFKRTLDKLPVKLNDEQFNGLWRTLRVNEFGNVDYDDFLQQYSSKTDTDMRVTNSAPPPTANGRTTACSELGRLSADRGSVMSTLNPNRCFTPMVNATNVERNIQEVVCRNWKEVQRNCKHYDVDNSGQVSYDVFRLILKRLDNNLHDEDINTLFLKYDLKNNNHFCYNDFLRHFVLNMQQPEGNLLNRKKLRSNTLPAGEDAASRVRHCVTNQWKDMRRKLVKIDKSNSGFVTQDELRQMLRNHHLNLEENEFQGLVSMFHIDVTGKINYNNFLKAFIQS